MTRELSCCVVGRVVARWSGGAQSTLRPWNEDPRYSAKEEELIARLLDAASPAMETLLAEVAARGVRLQKEPIEGVAPVVFRSATLTLELSCKPREPGVVALRELSDRFEALLQPAPKPVAFDAQRFASARERFNRQLGHEPTHLQLLRWLELAPVAFESAPETSPCALCGDCAVQVTEEWTDDDWHAGQHSQAHALCLAEPHVVTLYSR